MQRTDYVTPSILKVYFTSNRTAPSLTQRCPDSAQIKLALSDSAKHALARSPEVLSQLKLYIFANSHKFAMKDASIFRDNVSVSTDLLISALMSVRQVETFLCIKKNPCFVYRKPLAVYTPAAAVASYEVTLLLPLVSLRDYALQSR